MYEDFADAFAVHAELSAHNAHYDRPAVLRLLGHVAGQRILDVGCGSGLYAAELVERGAEVVGFDGSDRLVQLARQRVGSVADLRVHEAERGAPLHRLRPQEGVRPSGGGPAGLMRAWSSVGRPIASTGQP